MRDLRLIADDLTGALDAAAPFATEAAPLPVRWPPLPRQAGGSLVLDTETRELDGIAAEAGTRAAAGLLAGADLAFKKLDSRLRGHAAREIAACLAGGYFSSAVIAPAFPAQGRVMRGGRQLVRSAGGLDDVGVDLSVELAALGVEVRLVVRRGSLSGPGVHLCDAESDEDLVAIVEAGRGLPGPVLWCGTAGLARALAGASGPASLPASRGRWLTLIGTPHPVSREQAGSLAAERPAAAIILGEGDALPPLASSPEDALVHLDLPDGTSVEAACAAVDTVGKAMAEQPPPGLLVVSGGDTLIRLCRALDAEGLGVVGELTPGIPLSILEGGAWAGVAVVSKSGGFGGPRVLLDIIERYERG